MPNHKSFEINALHKHKESFLSPARDRWSSVYLSLYFLLEVLFMSRVIIIVFVVIALVAGCSTGNRGADRPTGMTGTGSPGSTTGTGTAAPTGTVGTGGTTDPEPVGAVIPKEGENTTDDRAITAAVKARLKEAGLENSIEVKTDDGIVTLKGTVSSQEQLEQVLKMVREIPDVESVTSEVIVR
jgi:hyperosmotically inducible periplasmic protein